TRRRDRPWHSRRRGGVWRRRHHPGDIGAERARGHQDAAAGIRALRVAAVDLGSHRAVLPATPGHRAHRPAVRPDHDALVRDDRGARAARYHPPSRRAGGARPALRAPLSVRAWIDRLTVIASQSIISGTFSMTRQAIQLGLCPRLHITQTSSEGYGQIYVGFVNWTLMVLTLGLALTFRSSENLASAFGIAVALTMLLTSLLMFLAMREVWGWSLPLSIAVAGLFTIVDLSFVAANMMKVFEGGWVPLVVGAALYFAMSTWRQGRTALMRKLERDTMPLGEFIAQVHGKARVPGTAVYLTSRVDVVPVPLLHNL